MATVTMTMEEYLNLVNGLTSEMPSSFSDATQSNESIPKKRKMTAYQRRYKSNFRKIAPKYKKQNGEWKKGGFKRAVQEAHRMSKK